MFLLPLFALLGTAALLLLYLPARRDVRAARRQLQAIRHETINTPCGQIAYAVRGDGYPLLLVHGAAGGYDQGLDAAREYDTSSFQVIAPSRFGYPGTPLPARATPDRQADAFVCLLDALGIEEAAVAAYSAGGPSAVQLAQRHPERVSALVLVSTALAAKPLSLPPQAVFRGVVHSDSLFWLMTHPLRSLTQRLFVPADLDLTPAQDAEVAATVEGLLPITARADGLYHDIFVTNTDTYTHPERYRLEEIEVPVLVVNAKDDPAAAFAAARAMSQRIPGAHLLTVPRGGHLMLDNGSRVSEAIDDFLHEYAG